ncbi:bifunctional 2-C-methyl-D-erythritol 4-phosphate cytidylyltransferase/2-C-methyl-D-erythritol 2,4-cyclodiphosphate synthase [Lutibaculum baratangense]|uniref:Bifunctional enzyme IspD/IspF n=1 Tax=Lutibaculum baratangense AMV1 TaxID=631454 RepID=V4R5I1_9HYPH|nr:bifunctional 2-C-methyl-D-erythritol 4-phosphate cytidylyltransferase/2-C-methyl-D-erythritol 2,4-cyclodiphosphate synthase [Lutibaculum baratangense]ESR27207.1 2-C-methyl-D-erythritol 4-phosphate cytidylyltransferase [Lutibaculum baratangense AMV1]
MKTAAIILAAGTGTRAADPADPRPKQYRPCRGESPLGRSVRTFLSVDAVSIVQPVIRPGDVGEARRLLPGGEPRLLAAVAGGETRQASVLRGLEALQPHAPDLVLIHDAVRPFLTPALIGRVIDALAAAPAVLPAVPVADTLKRERDGFVAGTLDRAGLHAAQTPQGFHFAAILEAHRRAAAAGGTHTDDASVAEAAGLPVRLVPGETANRKITTLEDFEMVGADGRELEYRAGQGYDVHRLVDGDGVTLCGVSIPHDRSLSGHSDADVALHALTDALLGTIGEGDIGDHFPPSDPQWRGAASSLFVRHAVERVTARGGRVINADITLVCEAPKIGPHREKMRGTVAALLGVTSDRVGVKATTNERLGFLGRSEGIAAMAVVSVAMPTETRSNGR